MLKIENISKAYQKNQVLSKVSFEVNTGEIMAITGESGCGKSTLLRIIGGLEKADSGSIFFDGDDISNWKPEKRRFGFVFQNLSLFPHLNVEQNIFFAIPKPQRTKEKLHQLLHMTGMSGYERRFPHELSGGQQQRIALARALSIDPNMLILDEPFSSLDELVKERIRKEVFELLRELNITTLMVSHQASDTFLIADELVVMKNGEILQQGKPKEVYEQPLTPYVSNFFGANVVIKGYKEDGVASTSFGKISLENIPDQFSLCIRPENIIVKNESDFNISGKVVEKSFKGPHDVLTVQSENEQEQFSLEIERCPHQIGETIFLKVPEDKILIFT